MKKLKNRGYKLKSIIKSKIYDKKLGVFMKNSSNVTI